MDGLDGTYTLYRRKNALGDEWTIAEGRKDHPRILDQSTFEDTIYKLLK
jgi:hypothetical protein